MKVLFLVAISWFAIALSNSAQSQTIMCGTDYSGGVSGTGEWDENIRNSMCGSSVAQEAQNMYGLRNFAGANCNANSERGRMLNALWVLRNAYGNYTSLSTPSNSGILRWAYKWSGDQTDILEPTCAEHTHFQKVNSGFPSYRNTYYMRFNGDWLFNGNVIERAAVILHEARHRQVGHVSDSACPRGASCDNFNSYGSNFYQWRWLQWFAVDSDSRFTDDMRQRAFDAAAYLGATGFSEGNVGAGVLYANTAARPFPLQKNSAQARGTEGPQFYVTCPTGSTGYFQTGPGSATYNHVCGLDAHGNNCPVSAYPVTYGTYPLLKYTCL